MKKVLCTMLFSTLVFLGFLNNVKAEEFDYNKCTLNCSGAGDNDACMATCDAKKFIEEKKSECNKNETCENKWEDAFQIKYQYYLDYHKGTSSDDGFNYSTFDYDTCWFNCQGAKEYSGYCKSECQAKQEVQQCILDAWTSQTVKSCKNRYNNIYQQKLEDNGVIETPENDTTISDKDKEKYNYCSNKCSKECDYTKDPSIVDPNGCSRYCYEDCVENYGKSYTKIQCGDSKIPYIIPQIVRTIILVLQIATPVIIIIIGSIDFVKAIIAQKEDEIKKGQQTFLRRLLVGACVFLVFFIVEIVIGIVAPQNDSDNENMWNCIDCFVNGDCEKEW